MSRRIQPDPQLRDLLKAAALAALVTACLMLAVAALPEPAPAPVMPTPDVVVPVPPGRPELVPTPGVSR